MSNTSFLLTQRKSDNEFRYYAGGCRVRKQVYETVGDGKRECFLTLETPTHFKHYHERRL